MPFEEPLKCACDAVLRCGQYTFQWKALFLMIECRSKHSVSKLVLDCDFYQFSENIVKLTSFAVLKRKFDCVSKGGLGAFNQCSYQRRLVGKILVNRSDTDASDFSDPVRVEAIEGLVAQNASSSFKNCFNRSCSPRLLRLFTRVEQLFRHVETSQCKCELRR